MSINEICCTVTPNPKCVRCHFSNPTILVIALQEEEVTKWHQNRKSFVGGHPSPRTYFILDHSFIHSLSLFYARHCLWLEAQQEQIVPTAEVMYLCSLSPSIWAMLFWNCQE